LENIFDQDHKVEFQGRGVSSWLLALTYSISGKIDERYDILDQMEEHFRSSKNFKPLEKFIRESLKHMKEISATDEELTLFLYVTYLELLYARDRINEQPDVHLKHLLKLLLELSDKAKRDMFNDLEIAVDFLEIVLKRRIGELSDEKAKQGLKKIMSAKLEIEKQWAMYANFEMAEILYLTGGDLHKAELFVKSCANFKCAADDIFGVRINAALRDVQRAKTYHNNQKR
jgi:hypothetical protein